MNESGVRVAQLLAFCVVFYISLFFLFLLDIVLPVLRFNVSDYLPLVSTICSISISARTVNMQMQNEI